jgi:hypothetical protein
MYADFEEGVRAMVVMMKITGNYAAETPLGFEQCVMFDGHHKPPHFGRYLP